MEIYATVVGVSFRGKEAREIVKGLTTKDGEKLTLVAEPGNEYDDHAVMVFHNPSGVHIGYLSRENNKQVFEELTKNIKLNVRIVSFEATLKPILLITDND